MNNLKDKEDKTALAITACSFNCRVGTGFKVSAFNKLCGTLTGNHLEIGN